MTREEEIRSHEEFMFAMRKVRENEHLLKENQRLREALERITNLPEFKASVLKSEIARQALEGSENGI